MQSPQTRTTQEIGKHPLDKEVIIMETPKGTEFYIAPENNGLYVIKMKKAGGKVPAVCDESFTNLKLAQRALEGYISTKE